MIFNVKDIEQFQAQKQFIDTAIIPLVQINLVEGSIKQSSSAVNYLITLTTFIEQQFRGRILLMPPFSYTDRTKNEYLPTQLKEELHNVGFKSVIFITTDHFWVKEKGNLDILWLPAIPLESMDNTVKQRILEDQLKQIIPVLTDAWA